MERDIGKRTRNGSGKNDKQGLLRGAAVLGKSLGAAIESVAKTGSGILLQERGRDKFARRCRELREELDARIKLLEKQELYLPELMPYSAYEFEQIIEMETKQKEDTIIWKAYSKRGGIYDILADIRKAVKCPSSNAFEFDNEEGTYIIFITINNTYIRRIIDLCSEMRSECGRIEKMDGSNLQEKEETLQEIYNGLCSEREHLSKKSFLNQWKKALGLKQEEQEKALLKLGGDLDSYEQKRKNYNSSVKAYQERLVFFMEECEQKKIYAPRYGKLFEELAGLADISRENHPFYILTISPEGETDLEQYMESAREFSKWTLHITEKYPL